MKVEYFEDPCPHFIIDDFLTPRAAREVLQEAIDLEPFYQQAVITGDHTDAPHPESCEECAIKAHEFRNTIRDNQTVYLDNLFENKRNKSKTLTYLHAKMIDIEFINLMENSKRLFPVTNLINSSETLISRYGKCEFYGWHTDSIKPNTESRIITVSYYVNKEPLSFDGGNLLLLGKNHNIKKIEPKHNRAVIFESNYATHSVEYVNLTGKNWDEGRFSVQFWLGFNNRFKFR